MRFDYTKGKEAKYLVGIHGENFGDQYYFHYYKEAKAMFDKMKENHRGSGVALNLYDMTNDVRKAFLKL